MSVIAWLKGRKKAAAGAVGVILAWGPVAQAADFPAAAWWGLAGGIAGVLGIHAATNEPQSWVPRDAPASLGSPDAGQVNGGGLVLLLIGFLLGVLSVKAGLL